MVKFIRVGSPERLIALQNIPWQQKRVALLVQISIHLGVLKDLSGGGGRGVVTQCFLVDGLDEWVLYQFHQVECWVGSGRTTGKAVGFEDCKNLGEEGWGEVDTDKNPVDGWDRICLCTTLFVSTVIDDKEKREKAGRSETV